MPRFMWVLLIVVAFGGVLAAGLVPYLGDPEPPQGREAPGGVAALQQQIETLQQQLAAQAEELVRLRQRLHAPAAGRPAPQAGAATAATVVPRPAEPAPTSAQDVDEAAESAQASADAAAEPPSDVALARFYQYLDDSAGLGSRQRRRQARALLNDLRQLGDAAVEALLGVLQDGTDNRERRSAAGLLGALQDERALPVLQDILESEEDILLRRAATRGLSRLQMPETIPALQTILANGQEDRPQRLP